MYGNCLQSSNPHVVCDQIIKLVKNAGINFHLVETPLSLKLSLKKSPTTKIYPVKLDTNANRQYRSPFPPPGFPISQTSPQAKVTPEYDTKYTDLNPDYQEFKLEFDNLESSKIALEKD